MSAELLMQNAMTVNRWQLIRMTPIAVSVFHHVRGNCRIRSPPLGIGYRVDRRLRDNPAAAPDGHGSIVVTDY
ncbi:hypothetical protein [Antrihabitans sp. YC2-6]|uniref:hypothetical protein n=1 Tax=Antrihabitans sp. YC2-6 TaxID=2799498 RepID=UPI0018F4EF4F|nr:hypothetical protein [Antrihabitans sp. YC2-6]MBJ8348668.1 hypothetical protein [Antrihabitans sp. YC2-6]